MCFGPKIKTIETPTTPDASAVADTAVAAEAAPATKKKTGRSQLTIDVSSGGSASGSGVNLPV